MKAFLILEDGTIFSGGSFGAERETICEVVFNTSMAGYVETLTNPNYLGQGVVMTYPLIGNYGMCNFDSLSAQPWLSAFFVREFADYASNFRNEVDVAHYLEYHGVPGLEGIDTRALTRKLRNSGSMNCMLTYDERNTSGDKLAEITEKLRRYKADPCAVKVSRATGEWQGDGGARLAIMDLGAVFSAEKNLLSRGHSIKTFHCSASAEDILKSSPDAVIISNGPGNPELNTAAIIAARELYSHGIPIFAFCLGHLTLALATGAQTYKLKHGHYGANHPVKDLESGKIYITTQNSGYSVEPSSVDLSTACVNLSHVNDKTVEGLKYSNSKALSVQFFPDFAGGSPETGNIFDKFLNNI